jgi:hypothetical protein
MDKSITKFCVTCDHGFAVPRDRQTCPRCGADLLFKQPTSRLGGVEAAATCGTRHWNIWSEAVELAAIGRDVDAEWLRALPQRKRLSRAYAAGEPVWMVADEMIQRWAGETRAAMESADGLAVLRKAVAR